MALTRQEVFHLLPNSLPEDRIPPRFRDVLKQLEPLHAHVLGWIIILAQEFEQRALWRDIPGYDFASYGIADREREGDAFAVLVYARRMPNTNDKVHEIVIDQHTFSVFVRRPYQIYHSPTIHPAGGRSTCWAVSTKSTTQAVLTAKHVLRDILGRDPQIGDQVPMTHGSTTLQGTIRDLGPDGIDAALVEPPGSSKPSSGNQFDAVKNLAPWMDVTIDAAAGPVKTMITAVPDVRGVLRSSLLPGRVITAKSCHPGDSGSLVIDSQGKGVGIYMGELVDPALRTEGISQHLWQVVDLMNLNLAD